MFVFERKNNWGWQKNAMVGEFSGRMGHVVAHPGNSGGNERPKRKMMPREGERRDENPEERSIGMLLEKRRRSCG